MVKTNKAQLDPLKQLLFIVTDEDFLPKQLAAEIGTLNGVLEDLGERMGTELRDRWWDRLSEAATKCEDDTSGVMGDVRTICGAALQALGGRFYEIVEKDSVSAGMAYEEAASRLGKMSSESWGSLAKDIIDRKSPLESEQSTLSQDKLPALERQLAVVSMSICYYQKLPQAGLWDCAGDAYYRAGNNLPDVQRCYKTGLNIVEAGHAENLAGSPAAYMLGHLALPYAHLLTGSQARNELERLYRKVSDAVFFNLEKKENEAYQNICGVMIYGTGASLTIFGFIEPFWFPHASILTSGENQEWLLKLKTELGEKALTVLRTDYDKSEEGFPVPETYHLVAILSELYKQSNDFEKCANFLDEDTQFNGDVFDWSFDELFEADWVSSFVQLMENKAYARGILRRPDYKEFIERIKQFEERQQRQEWKQIRHEKMLEEASSSRVDVDEVQSSLTRKRPWLKLAANIGAVVNSECLYHQLEKRSWSEVVMGYCNAVEAEVEDFLYKEYIAFVAEKSYETYGVESQRQKKRGSVLYYLSDLTNSKAGQSVWENFVSFRFPKSRHFLLKEFPKSLTQLREFRNLAAHGEILERSQASGARDLVLGTQHHKGLLESLVHLRSEHPA